MLNYNELKPGENIVLDGQPYVVMDYKFLRMQQRKPVAQTKIKNLITGKTIEKTFQQNDKIREAEIGIREIKYLYSNKGELWFCEKDDPSKRFKLEEDLVGAGADLLKPNSIVDAVVFDDKIIGVRLPIKVDLKVADAPPAVKGDTAQGGVKQVTLETGAIITAPMFINEGDIVRINTETKEYVERVKKE
ncbi:MAG: elongation factor P [bacterium]|nr:elongation factor P [bacterium]